MTVRIFGFKSLRLMMATVVGTVSFFATKDALACPTCDFYPYVCSPCCDTTSTQQYIEDAFDDYRKDFIMNSYYKNQWENDGFKPQATSFFSKPIWSAATIGAFLDGYNADAAQAELQSLNAETRRDYQVSESICRFGTLSRSLSSSDQKAKANQMQMSEIGIARNLGTDLSVASTGRGLDNQSRLYAFTQFFCDNMDNNDGLAQLCSAAGSTRDVEFNRDIDFTRTIDDRDTLNIDFTNATLSRDEKDVVFLGNMIYGHRQDTKRLEPGLFKESRGGAERYANIRSVVARRAAAQNTFDVISSMKASGGPQASAYITNFLTHMGMGSGQINKYFKGRYIGSPAGAGDVAAEPSYYAQMDILAKKIYQDPSFYAGLMESNANVKRISASMEAIGLAQDRDIYTSMSRSEMLMALLLEMQARQQAEFTKKGLNRDMK